MAAAGDILLDFTGLANVDPYSNADYTYLDVSRLKIASGLITRSVADAPAHLLYTATAPTADILRCEVEMSYASSSGYDVNTTLLITDENLNGYRLTVQGNYSYLRAITNGAEVESLESGDPSYGSGTVLALEYQVSTGRLEVFKDGVSTAVNTSTLHTTGLKVGFGAGGSVDTKGLLSFGATVYAAADYTIRKGSSATITHTLTAGGITGATLNGEAVTLDTQSGQTVDITFDSALSTSGVYDLVLTDSAAATQTLTVQYNVFAIASDTIEKEGVAIGAHTDLELVVLTGAEGSRVLAEQKSGLTTDASGITGNTIVNAAGLVDTTAVYAIWKSDTAGVQWGYETTVELI